jgi:uncharacterized OB-fold protein
MRHVDKEGLMSAKPMMPNTADRETRGFFEAAAKGKLVYRVCNDCNHALHPPTAHCPYCGGWNTDWREAKGTGRLHAGTHVIHQAHPAYPTPYTLVVVALDEAPEVRLGDAEARDQCLQLSAARADQSRAHRRREDDILAPSVRIYDPWFLLGAVAGATETLKIGTAICIAPLNNPLLLARATVTAHDVSGGRFRLGLGAGWLREEFDAVGVPFEERGTRLDETIEILKNAWKGGFFEHEGPHFKFGPVQITPHAPADLLRASARGQCRGGLALPPRRLREYRSLGPAYLAGLAADRPR